MPTPVPVLAQPDAAASDLVLIGALVRMQVQISPLKQGEKPLRWYRPDAITPVPELALDSGGVVGFDGETVKNDVHHRDHPLSRYRGENGVSIGFTSHYEIMRAEFGDFLHDGIAGENLLVASDARHTEDEFAGGIVIMTATGPVELTRVQVAPPCVEFGKFCLRYPNDQKADAQVAQAVKFLHQGVRGFYATWQPENGADSSPRIALGDRVYRRA
ncbi:MAG: hypothetical protein QM589_02020 [Thermomicrobiales bacterium]